VDKDKNAINEFLRYNSCGQADMQEGLLLNNKPPKGGVEKIPELIKEN